MRDFESREEAENEAFFKRLQTKLLLYGPTPVIQEWLAWRRLGETLSEPNITLVLTWERVLRAIRKDLGHDPQHHLKPRVASSAWIAHASGRPPGRNRGRCSTRCPICETP
jgi:hypothetical protein